MNSKFFVPFLIILLLAAPASAKKFSFKRQIIKKVEIEGNRYFSDGKLKQRLLTKPNHWYNIFRRRRLARSNLQIDQKQLERFYGQNGFLFAEVTAEASYYKDDSSKAAVIFQIDESKRVYVQQLLVSGGLENLNRQTGKFTKNIKPGKPVDHDAVTGAIYRIRDLYADNGYPFAAINSQYRFSYDSSLAVIFFDIAESTFVYNGEINIVQEGDVQTNPKILRRELITKPGQPYSRKNNLESQQRVYSTGLIKFISLKRLGEPRYISGGRDTAITDFKLIVTVRKPNYVDFRIGIDQVKDFNSVLQTSVSWGNNNLWGTGRKLILSASNGLQMVKKGTTERALTIGDLFKDLKLNPVRNSLGISYIEPWLLGYRMPLSLRFVYEPQNFNPILLKYYDRLTGEAALVKWYGAFTNLRFSSRIEFVKIHGVAPAEEKYFRLEGDNSIRRRLSLYGTRDTRDNIFVPQKGSYTYSYVDYVGHILGGDFNYIKGEFSWSRYRLLFGQNLLATRFRIGALQELGPEGNSSSDDRFFLGGATTVRGYAENALGPVWTAKDGVTEESGLLGKPKGGRLLLLANFELRRPLFWRFGGTAFVDMGNDFFYIRDFKPNRIRATAGLGLQFFTPVGPIRLDYAFLVQRQLDLSEYALHFTLLYAF